MRLAIAIFTYLALLFAWGTGFAAERRVALIVANSTYAGAPLSNPQIDAELIRNSLLRTGFDVSIVANADLAAFDLALSSFADHALGADVALFYYAGHGFAVNDGARPQNVLMSVNADMTSASERVLRAGGIPLDEIVSQLSGRAKATLVFIDACRSMPHLQRGAVGAGRGLTPGVNFSGNSLYVAVSTQLGETASDGEANKGSPFARNFAAVVIMPGLRIDDAFRILRDRVSAETGGRQVPDVVKDDLPSGSLALLPKLVPPVLGAGECGGIGALAGLASRAARPLTANETCALKAGDVFKECADCPEMIIVPSGSTMMGSPGPASMVAIKDTGNPRNVPVNSRNISEVTYPNEKPRHMVNIASPFAVARYDVTKDQFQKFVEATGYDAGLDCRWEPTLSYMFDKGYELTASWQNPGFAQSGSHPVVCVDWSAARAFANWVSKETDKHYRLLSDTEFEYAARAETVPSEYRTYFFGNDISSLCNYGNVADLSFSQSAWYISLKHKFDPKDNPGKVEEGTPLCTDGFVFTSPVGIFQPNAFSLYDMAGNVWQWVEDCGSESDLEFTNTDLYKGHPIDGSPNLGGDCSRARFIRGGSFAPENGAWRAADHLAIPPMARFNSLGFRVAETFETH